MIYDIFYEQIQEQEVVQNNMIQKMISMSLSDPEVMKTLLAMLNKQNIENSSSLVMFLSLSGY